MLRSLVLRSLVWGLVCVGLAPAATAGDVILPWGPGVCAGVFAAQNSIIAPNMFLGFVRCAELCKATGKDCAKFTKDAYACENGLISDDLDYSRRECDNISDKATHKSCELLAKTNADVARGLLKTDLDSALGFCSTWQSECLSFCSGT